MSLRRFLTIASCLSALTAVAQPRFSQPHGLYDDHSLTVAISGNSQAQIHYTTDGSTPTAASSRYRAPLTITTNTLLRAVEVFADSVSPITTATYLFTNSVLNQPEWPEGYPQQWGDYTELWGTATADYGMDRDMTADPSLRAKIARGLKTLPILSIVTDKENLFSHDNDEEHGGIYIFTGPPVGDPTGHGWTRPASVELFSSADTKAAPMPTGDGRDSLPDFSTTCGLRLHGGHGRLAEKNPKHSFRLVFKEKYGPKTLKYPLFGAGEPKKFDQLVLRCHFGNAWQHWGEDNRQKAQYSRDVWMRRMQRKMGHVSVNALYVHLFLNGMYWGLYNIAERVDEQFVQDHLGGKEAEADVIKIEEDGGNHIEAAAGTLDAWQLMTATARAAATSDDAYQQLDTLLNLENFIDYMLINQYGGNTDWAHHNWYAIRRHNNDSTASTGFHFLCWDTEIIFTSPSENVLAKNDGHESPTGIFQSLLRNPTFARRYVSRARQLLADDGLLGQPSVVAVWDSLYNTIATALYDEAARWGDYRRDVHPYQSRGQLYTVDNHYMAERNRLLTQYFPVRSQRVLDAIISYVDIDDFEAPAEWEPLMATMFRQWDGTGTDAHPLDRSVSVDWNIGTAVGGGGAVAGFVGVQEDHFADISGYDRLVLRGTGSGLRILANRLVAHGPWKQITVSFNDNDPYWDATIGAIVLPLEALRTAPTNEGMERRDAFVHLNALKVDWGNTATVKAAYLVPSSAALDVSHATAPTADATDACYTLSGQRVSQPRRGLYIKNGKKVFVK